RRRGTAWARRAWRPCRTACWEVGSWSSRAFQPDAEPIAQPHVVLGHRPRGELERAPAVRERAAAATDVELRVRDREVAGPQEARAIADRQGVVPERLDIDDLVGPGLRDLHHHGLGLAAHLLLQDLGALADARVLARDL